MKRPDGSYKSRCRMHGGAAGSGAPAGNSNALKHGFYTAEAKMYRQEMQDFLIATAATLKALTDSLHQDTIKE